MRQENQNSCSITTRYYLLFYFCSNLIEDPVLHFLSQVRGIGTDIAIVSCMVFLAQVTFKILVVVVVVVHLCGKLMPVVGMRMCIV